MIGLIYGQVQKRMLEENVDMWDLTLRTNVTSLYMFTSAFLPLLCKDNATGYQSQVSLQRHSSLRCYSGDHHIVGVWNNEGQSGVSIVSIIKGCCQPPVSVSRKLLRTPQDTDQRHRARVCLNPRTRVIPTPSVGSPAKCPPGVKRPLLTAGIRRAMWFGLTR